MPNKYQSLYVTISEKRNIQKSNSKKLLGNIILAAVILLLLLSALGKIYLDRQVKKMVRDWQVKNEQLSLLKKESHNLILEQEEYMGGHHILSEAEKLDLRPPEPGQVRMLTAREFQTRYMRSEKSQNSLVALR